MSANSPSALAPDAVRVWRGFRAPTMDVAAFYERLNTVFVPATVLMQVRAGLGAYIPTVLAGLPGKPDEAPDETAILFWGTRETYSESFKKLAVRTYTLTHGAVYTPNSGAGFPLQFTGELEANQPYHLTTRAADWMHGTVRHLVGGRPPEMDPASFRAGLAQALASFEANDELAGAIVCAGDDYLVYWELECDSRQASDGTRQASGDETSQASDGTRQASGDKTSQASDGTRQASGDKTSKASDGTRQASGEEAGGDETRQASGERLEALAARSAWCHVVTAQPTSLESGLWDDWTGMSIKAGDSLNLRFRRRWER